jgi:vacuolar-type H+-ATPase subunit C/Vma6
MHTAYIYSASRVTATDSLLTKADLDRLLVAHTEADFVSALKETYFASYYLHAGAQLDAAITAALQETKELLESISPQPDVFRRLWLPYDVHNLRVLAKAAAAAQSAEQVAAYLSPLGNIAVAALETAVTNQQLDAFESGWQALFEEALEAAKTGSLPQVEQIFDRLYFDTAQRMVSDSGDDFMQTFHQISLDIHNLQTRLRQLTHPSVIATTIGVKGGRVSVDALETKEQVLAAYTNLGGEALWREAIEYYETTGNTTRLDARAEEYLMQVTKEAAHDIFSSASLVLYYLRNKHATDNIRTIQVGVAGGMRQEDIKANLRITYGN